MIDEVLEAHPEEVFAYKNGKETVANWLFGQVMRNTKGKANPQVIKKVLHQKLKQK